MNIIDSYVPFFKSKKKTIWKHLHRTWNATTVLTFKSQIFDVSILKKRVNFNVIWSWINFAGFVNFTSIFLQNIFYRTFCKIFLNILEKTILLFSTLPVSVDTRTSAFLFFFLSSKYKTRTYIHMLYLLYVTETGLQDTLYFSWSINSTSSQWLSTERRRGYLTKTVTFNYLEDIL